MESTCPCYIHRKDAYLNKTHVRICRKELSIKVFPLLNSNLCAVNLLETYVAFDKISTHISNLILKNQMTVNPYQLISVPDCVFRICDALNKVQSVYKEAVNP